jgi:probable rRNA maturation factor
MSKFIIYSDGQEFPAERAELLEEAVGEFVCADVPLAIEFVFVDETEIRRLNGEIRGIDKVTDVLSFPTLDGIKGQEIKGENHPFDFDEEDNLLIGSVAVCCARARDQAEEYGHSYERELHYLLVHGILHCLGYDHETEEERAEMREAEEQVLQKLGITRE